MRRDIVMVVPGSPTDAVVRAHEAERGAAFDAASKEIEAFGAVQAWLSGHLVGLEPPDGAPVPDGLLLRAIAKRPAWKPNRRSVAGKVIAARWKRITCPCGMDLTRALVGSPFAYLSGGNLHMICVYPLADGGYALTVPTPGLTVPWTAAAPESVIAEVHAAVAREVLRG